MVDIDTIDKFNEELQAKAPDLYTKKTFEEIEEFKELMGLNFSNGGKRQHEAKDDQKPLIKKNVTEETLNQQ